MFILVNGKIGFGPLGDVMRGTVAATPPRTADSLPPAARGPRANDPTRTALVVVDPYNDFISEGGKLHELSRGTITSQDCVTHMREVLAAARAAGLLVCYAPHRRWRPGDYDTWHYTAPTQEAVAKNQVFAAESWGGTFHPHFQPAPDEVVAQEHWLSSGFANTDLDLILKRHGVERVIVIGLRANTCIDSTVQINAPSYARTRTLTAELVRALDRETEHGWAERAWPTSTARLDPVPISRAGTMRKLAFR